MIDKELNLKVAERHQEFVVKQGGYAGAEQTVFEFPNGLGASVVQNDYSYGANDGLFELAVLDDVGITYETPITDDVLGYLTQDDVDETLDEIMALG